LGSGFFAEKAFYTESFRKVSEDRVEFPVEHFYINQRAREYLKKENSRISPFIDLFLYHL
jgi:hypothetical protein